MCYSADISMKLYPAEHFNNWECSSGVSTVLMNKDLDTLDLSAALLLHNHGVEG